MADLHTWTRVEVRDGGEVLRGTVVSGTETPGPVLVMWDSEKYDANSLGHEIPDDLVSLLRPIAGRVPVLHRFHPMVGVSRG